MCRILIPAGFHVSSISALGMRDCVEALNKDFRTKTIKDIRALAFLSLDLAMANTSEAAGFVGGMAVNAPVAMKLVLEYVPR
ncbi:hypothetical protein SAY86_026497 [Trapa natans]|uniref:Uncharacterized protein n=1 Tax=Trapa natans TaxID=22666 RepID=A0AAN7QEL8_TRANT|nr:hypothetical protein SAY86_026497 [Trapa natans]